MKKNYLLVGLVLIISSTVLAQDPSPQTPSSPPPGAPASVPGKPTGENRKYQDDPLADIGKERQVHDVCSSFQKPGSCTGDKIALIAYSTSVRGAGNTGDDECEVLKQHLVKKGFCIESVPLASAQSDIEFLANNPQLKQRYSYLANIGHGSPGQWINLSVCESASKDKCKNVSNTYDMGAKGRCAAKARASEELSSSCPCWKEEAAAQIILPSGGETLPADPDFIVRDRNDPTAPGTPASECLYPKWDEATQKNAYAFHACIKANKVSYEDKQNLGVYGQLLKPYSTIFSVSCSTGADPEKTKEFAQTLCLSAPAGTMFNVSLTPVFPAEAVLQSGRQADIRKPTQGDFECYKCNSSGMLYEKIDCSGFDFPENVKDAPPTPQSPKDDQIPQQNKK